MDLIGIFNKEINFNMLLKNDASNRIIKFSSFQNEKMVQLNLDLFGLGKGWALVKKYNYMAQVLFCRSIGLKPNGYKIASLKNDSISNGNMIEFVECTDSAQMSDCKIKVCEDNNNCGDVNTEIYLLSCSYDSILNQKSSTLVYSQYAKQSTINKVNFNGESSNFRLNLQFDYFYHSIDNVNFNNALVYFSNRNPIEAFNKISNSFFYQSDIFNMINSHLYLLNSSLSSSNLILQSNFIENLNKSIYYFDDYTTTTTTTNTDKSQEISMNENDSFILNLNNNNQCNLKIKLNQVYTKLLILPVSFTSFDKICFDFKLYQKSNNETFDLDEKRNDYIILENITDIELVIYANITRRPVSQCQFNATKATLKFQAVTLNNRINDDDNDFNFHTKVKSSIINNSNIIIIISTANTQDKGYPIHLESNVFV
jgi:hypothetical protein